MAEEGLLQPKGLLTEEDEDFRAGRKQAFRDMGLLRPTDGPGSTSDEESDALTERSRVISEIYSGMDSNARRDDLLPPIQPDQRPVIDIANILVGDEMAAVGMSLDRNGFHWDLDTLTEAWSEHPVRSIAAVAFGIAPGLRATYKAFKASKWAGVTDDVITSTGLVDNLDDLARMSTKDKDLLKQQVYQIQRSRELKEAAKNAETAETLGGQITRDRVIYEFNKRFSNTYMDRINPDAPLAVKAQQIDRMNEAIKDVEVNKHLQNLPDAKWGEKIALGFLNPAKLNDLPDEVRPWAFRLMEDMTTLQKQAIEEGFITPAEAKKVGDAWFPTVREGTVFEQGPTTQLHVAAVRGKKGKTQVIKVPRTRSPHLLQRTADKKDVAALLTKQAASKALDAGDHKEALGLLKGKDYDDVRGLITSGNTRAAQDLLHQGGTIDVSPANLTVGGFLQQRLLFENFRYIRDIASDPNITRNAMEVAAMTPSARRNYMKLDNLPNAHIVRRMMGAQTKRAAPEELGYVHKSVWEELGGEDGQMGMAHGMASVLEFMTAVHKTAKTALNIPTHGQNVAGNTVFMMMAGWNPFNPEKFGMLKQSWTAIRDLQRASRTGKPVEEIKNIGKIKSKIGGDDIDIMDELRRPEVQEIIEQSSLIQSEGIGVLERIANNAADHQNFLKGIVNYTQRAFGVSRIDRASDVYMAEDGVFKLAYYLDLRSRGFNALSSALEVSRRLPMYHTVGNWPSAARKVWLPWVSFPAEAFRITKNNIMDNPLRTSMLLHFTQGLQALMYPAVGESYEGLEGLKKQLPIWAQRPVSTAITPLRDKNDDIRAASLDFLPHAAFLPHTSAPQATLLERMPFGLDQPMPILMGLYRAFTGKGTFGQDLHKDPDNPMETIAAGIMNTVGFIMPPFVQKYLINTNTPTPTWRLKQDWGKVVNPSTGKSGTALYDGLVNNLFISKMYPASGEQEIANQQVTQRALNSYRGKLTRNWNAMIKSGDWEGAGGVLTDIQDTFNREWGNPGVAQQKFTEWLQRHVDSLRRHPMLRGQSKEKLQVALANVGDQVSKARGRAMADYIRAMRQELAARGGSSKGGSRSPVGYQ